MLRATHRSLTRSKPRANLSQPTLALERFIADYERPMDVELPSLQRGVRPSRTSEANSTSVRNRLSASGRSAAKVGSKVSDSFRPPECLRDHEDRNGKGNGDKDNPHRECARVHGPCNGGTTQ